MFSKIDATATKSAKQTCTASAYTRQSLHDFNNDDRVNSYTIPLLFLCMREFSDNVQNMWSTHRSNIMLHSPVKRGNEQRISVHTSKFSQQLAKPSHGCVLGEFLLSRIHHHHSE